MSLLRRGRAYAASHSCRYAAYADAAMLLAALAEYAIFRRAIRFAGCWCLFALTPCCHTPLITPLPPRWYISSHMLLIYALFDTLLRCHYYAAIITLFHYYAIFACYCWLFHYYFSRHVAYAITQAITPLRYTYTCFITKATYYICYIFLSPLAYWLMPAASSSLFTILRHTLFRLRHYYAAYAFHALPLLICHAAAIATVYWYYEPAASHWATLPLMPLHYIMPLYADAMSLLFIILLHAATYAIWRHCLLPPLHTIIDTIHYFYCRHYTHMIAITLMLIAIITPFFAPLTFSMLTRRHAHAILLLLFFQRWHRRKIHEEMVAETEARDVTATFTLLFIYVTAAADVAATYIIASAIRLLISAAMPYDASTCCLRCHYAIADTPLALPCHMLSAFAITLCHYAITPLLTHFATGITLRPLRYTVRHDTLFTRQPNVTPCCCRFRRHYAMPHDTPAPPCFDCYAAVTLTLFFFHYWYA